MEQSYTPVLTSVGFIEIYASETYVASVTALNSTFAVTKLQTITVGRTNFTLFSSLLKESNLFFALSNS